MRRIYALLTAGMFLASPAIGQETPKLLVDRSPEARPALLVLGSVHLHNPGRDAMNIEVDDVLALARQAQIAELVEQLAAYKPTHIAIEHLATDQATVDELYRSYRAGKRDLGRDEEEQIGMRLAAKLGLDRVVAIDWNGAPPGDPAHYNFAAYAKANGIEDRFKLLLTPSRIPYPPLPSTDLVTYYLAVNRPESVLASHRLYFDIARFGDDQSQPGANWVGSWYARNLKIFNKLVDITDRPDARVLVIYGAGHAYYLRQFANESGAFRLRDVSEFVKAPAKR